MEMPAVVHCAFEVGLAPRTTRSRTTGVRLDFEAFDEYVMPTPPSVVSADLPTVVGATVIDAKLTLGASTTKTDPPVTTTSPGAPSPRSVSSPVIVEGTRIGVA